MTLKTVVTYDGEGNMSMAQVVDTATREQIKELRQEADTTCYQFRQWMHDFRERVIDVTGPLYKEIIVNRLLEGNRDGYGSTMIGSDTAVGMFHAAGYNAFGKLEEALGLLDLYLQQADFFARVLEKLDEKAARRPA